jgi:colicin import membrane protein
MEDWLMLSKPFISLLLLAAVSQTIAAQGATSVLVCADIEKNELRLKCYDKVAKELAKDASSQRKPQSKFSDVEKAQIDADLESAYYAIKKMYAEMALRLAESEAKRAKNNEPQTQVVDSEDAEALKELRALIRQAQLARLGARETLLAERGEPSETYASKVVAAIRPNIIFAGTVAGNPTAEVEVTTLPTGEILGRRLIRSSGTTDWDTAVLRAIDRTQRLPKDGDDPVPSPMIIAFRPGN